MTACCNATFAAAAIGAHDVWLLAGGDSAGRNQQMSLYHSDDAAAHWTLVADTRPVPLPGVGRLPLRGLGLAVAATSTKRVWIAPEDGTLLGSLDSGATWFDTGIRTTSIQFVFVDPLHGWVWNGTDSYRATDGRNWTLATSSTP